MRVLQAVKCIDYEIQFYINLFLKKKWLLTELTFKSSITKDYKENLKKYNKTII